MTTLPAETRSRLANPPRTQSPPVFSQTRATPTIPRYLTHRRRPLLSLACHLPLPAFHLITLNRLSYDDDTITVTIINYLQFLRLGKQLHPPRL